MSESESPRSESPEAEMPHPEPPEVEPPPRGVRGMALVRWALIVLTALAAGFSWWSFARADDHSAHAARYFCPMHPEVTSAVPGECPICQMTLEPIPKDRLLAASASATPAAPPPSAGGATVYFCPMHPEVTSPTPARCPKCKMKLEPRAAGHDDAQSTDAGAPIVGSSPPGTADVELALDRVQAIGVRTEVAQEAPTSAGLRLAANVEAPESGVAEVHVRAPGFVEHIAVRETGVRVRRGQNLLSVYSPEIYQAQSELLAIKDWPALGEGKSSGDRAKKKLELLGMSKRSVDQLVAKGEPMRTVGVSSPIAGYVSKKNVVLGSYVTPETTLYEIVDLEKVYVIANVFQRDLASVKLGGEGAFSAPGLEKPVVAKVDLVYPKVDADARTTRVRFSVKNPDLTLRPGQFGWVEIAGSARTVVAVPRDALIDTGLERYVFVETGPGKFSPRRVEVGSELGSDRIELRAGVHPGERVVSGATFLIDSESRLKASLRGSGAPRSDDHSNHPKP